MPLLFLFCLALNCLNCWNQYFFDFPSDIRPVSLIKSRCRLPVRFPACIVRCQSMRNRLVNKCESMDQKILQPRRLPSTRSRFQLCPFLPLPLPRPLAVLSPEKLRIQGGHVAEGRGHAFWNRPIQRALLLCTSTRYKYWPICLKTSLFPTAPSGTARLGSCWVPISRHFGTHFEALVHGNGAGTCSRPVGYLYSINNTVIDMWDCC